MGRLNIHNEAVRLTKRLLKLNIDTCCIRYNKAETQIAAGGLSYELLCATRGAVSGVGGIC